MISSFSNPLIKRVKGLGQKKNRQKEGAFVVEGVRGVLAAMAGKASIETVLFCPDLLTSVPGRNAITTLQNQGVPCVAVSVAIFEAISERENPTGLAAIVQARLGKVSAWGVDPAGIYVALVEVADPGNIGTIIRTMDAVGATGLILVGNCVDPFHPTAVKASMGSLFGVSISMASDMPELFGWARQGGLQIVATSAKAKRSFWEVGELSRPVLLLMGSERHGLDEASQQAADLRLTIPMRGTATSLNLAVATGLILYEMSRPGR